MSDLLTIQIPFELATYAVWQRKLVNRYETNQVIRALDTWLVLKAEAPGSWIQDWNNQKTHLLQICKVSETIFRHRLQLLKKMDLITSDKKNIRLCSWKDLGHQLQIDISKKLIVQYDTTNKQRIHEWILAAEITDNQSRQAYMVLKTVNKNPELKMMLTAELLKRGADCNRISDPGYFLGQMKALYLDDFVRASEIHQDLIDVRPDTNRSVRKMAEAWRCKHAVTISYWKNILKTVGIIDVSKLQIQSDERVRNKWCKVIWLPKIKETLLCLCDQITVLQPWLIKNLLPA